CHYNSHHHRGNSEFAQTARRYWLAGSTRFYSGLYLHYFRDHEPKFRAGRRCIADAGRLDSVHGLYRNRDTAVQNRTAL
ncbi:MAG: hypothetical protein AVDCRST_MAG95-2039, partial [uncultured Adhaeribacter sp.]